MTKVKRLIPALALLVALAIPGLLSAQKSLIAVQEGYRALFKQVSPSVVAISQKTKEQVAKTIAPPGLVTNAETDCGFVVEGNYLICNPEQFVRDPGGDFKNWDPTRGPGEVKKLWAHLPSGDAVEAEVIGFDLRNLLMVCKLPEGHGIPALKLGNSQNVAIGENVAAFGNSFDSIVIDGRVSMSIGTLSDTYRLRAITPYSLQEEDQTVRPTFYRGDVLEFEGAVNPGDFGGPMVDMSGEVVGLLTRYVSPSRQLGTAVPSSQFADSFYRIINGEKRASPIMGFYTRQFKDKEFQGKVVTRMDAGGAAEVAGLKVGDVIQVVDGLRIEYDTSLPKIISWEAGLVDDPSYTLPPGAHISMVVMRDGKLLGLRIRAGGIPYGAKREKATEGAAAQFSRGQALLAQSASQYVVQVVIDRRTRKSMMPSVRGGREREAFMDLSVGPYTGVIVSSDGHILIADTILGSFVTKEDNEAGHGTSIRGIFVTLADGRSYKASVVGRHAGYDLALLKIDAKDLKAADFRAEDAKRGESLAVVTRSFGVDNYGAAMGICSAQNRESKKIFQIDARVGASDLGGLVVDKDGKPIGLVGHYSITTHGQGSGVAFALHSSTVREALIPMKAGKFLSAPPKPMLGVEAAPVLAGVAGLRVSRVTPGFPAALAGVEENDVLLAANDVELFKVENLRDVINEAGVGGLVKLTIRRTKDDGTETEIELTAQIIDVND